MHKAFAKAAPYTILFFTVRMCIQLIDHGFASKLEFGHKKIPQARRLGGLDCLLVVVYLVAVLLFLKGMKPAESISPYGCEQFQFFLSTERLTAQA